MLALVSVLLIPLTSAHQQGRHRLARWLSLGLVGLVTFAVVVSVFLLISSLLSGETPAPVLLQDAALLWVINIVTFVVWYWEIGGDGPAYFFTVLRNAEEEQRTRKRRPLGSRQISHRVREEAHAHGMVTEDFLLSL